MADASNVVTNRTTIVHDAVISTARKNVSPAIGWLTNGTVSQCRKLNNFVKILLLENCTEPIGNLLFVHSHRKLVPSKSQQNLMLGKSMLKLNASPAVVNSADAADGHDAKPNRAPFAPTTVKPEEHKPMAKSSDEPAKVEKQPESETVTLPPAVAIDNNDAKKTNAASDNSFHHSTSSHQKILLSMCGDSALSSTTAINRAATSSGLPSGSEVWITHVRNYETVYVRGVATSDAYMKLCQDVQAAALTAPKLKSYPYPKEDTVLAPFDGAYYRAMVLKCDENAGQVRVGYIDFGNTQEVPFTTLKLLPDELKERPRLTFMVKLKNLKDQPEEQEANAMKEHLDNISEVGTPQVLKITGDRANIETNDRVELFEVISNESVNDVLNGMVQKRYYLSHLNQKILKVDPANLPTLMAIDTLRVGDNIVTCLVKEDVNVFMEGDERTQNYGEAAKNAPAYMPKQKELCVVRIKDNDGYFWYRCLYQAELVDDRAQVYCIDYGKVDTVRANNIRVSLMVFVGPILMIWT